MKELKNLIHHFGLKDFNYEQWKENIKKASNAGLIYAGIDLDPKVILTITFRYFDKRLITRKSQFSIDRLKLFRI